MISASKRRVRILDRNDEKKKVTKKNGSKCSNPISSLSLGDYSNDSMMTLLNKSSWSNEVLDGGPHIKLNDIPTGLEEGSGESIWPGALKKLDHSFFHNALHLLKRYLSSEPRAGLGSQYFYWIKKVKMRDWSQGQSPTERRMSPWCFSYKKDYVWYPPSLRQRIVWWALLAWMEA